MVHLTLSLSYPLFNNCFSGFLIFVIYLSIYEIILKNPKLCFWFWFPSAIVLMSNFGLTFTTSRSSCFSERVWQSSASVGEHPSCNQAPFHGQCSKSAQDFYASAFPSDSSHLYFTVAFSGLVYLHLDQSYTSSFTQPDWCVDYPNYVCVLLPLCQCNLCLSLRRH